MKEKVKEQREEKEEEKPEPKKFIAWLAELSKNDIPLVGGKGANLGEMYNSKFPVPPAFVVTTQAYNYFLDKTGINQKINEIIKSIDVDDTKQLDKKALEIKKLVVESEMPLDLKQEILEAYDNFNVDLNYFKATPTALSIIKNSREPIFVSVRSSATAEDLGNASFAGQQESFTNVKGKSAVIESVKKVFASIFTARSIYYRKKKGFDGRVGIAVIVQKMINSQKSGVMFSVNPVKGENILIEAVFGQGEGIVSGTIKPDQYTVSRELEILDEKVADKKIAVIRDSSGETKLVPLTEEKSSQKVLKIHEVKQLAEYAIKLEEHYKQPQDIEFAIEEEIYIVQTRPITTLKDMKKQKEISGKLITSGLPASGGTASGIVRVVNEMSELEKVRKGDVLVTTMTNPDMVVSMQKASAIVTDEGGATAHAAIVSREMGIPCVVGTQNATKLLKDGMQITVDGSNGKVYEGIADTQLVEILPIVQTKTKIKVLVDLPEYAERAGKTNAFGVGLVRLEGIIAESGKHSLYYEKKGKLEEYKEVIKKGLSKIAEHFKDKEMWVRTSDIRSDEYAHIEGAPKEIERNPMLGMHGIRFSLKHPGILKAELLAIKELADKGQKFGIMFPQVISSKEVVDAKKIMQELEMLGNPNIKLGVMIETPAAVMVIDDICKQGIKFISFGTNDLTQFTLAIDRGNEEVQYLYNELDLAMQKSLSRVIRTCKEYKVETSICGQAASKKEMAEFLVKHGIDSLSVNADAAHEISVFVQDLERKLNKK